MSIDFDKEFNKGNYDPSMLRLVYEEKDESLFKTLSWDDTTKLNVVVCSNCNGRKFYVGVAFVNTTIKCCHCNFEHRIHEG